MAAGELRGASVDAVGVLGGAGGAEVELSDGLLPVVVGGLIMRGNLFPVTEAIYITEKRK